MASGQEGGAELFFERLAAGLKRVQVEQRLAVKSGTPRNVRLKGQGLDVVELPFGGLFDFKTAPALKRQAADFRPSVILSWMNRATKFCRPGDYVLAARLGGYYNLKYYRHCDHLIGNTRGIVDYLRREGWPENKTHYLPNFVSLPSAPPVARSTLNTPEDAPLALALGRLHPNKGFDVLLAAMEKLPRFHLWLAGEGPERQALESGAQTLGIAQRVHFLGWRPDTAALLAAVDMLVCPSRHEPLGNVVIEGWAARKPVVAAASAGPVELIRNGETGILTPVENADELAKAMGRLMGDPSMRSQLAVAGYLAYEAEYSEARVVGLYREFFESVSR
jgi:glycosyltransferase involved in cell wall biosynthesis